MPAPVRHLAAQSERPRRKSPLYLQACTTWCRSSRRPTKGKQRLSKVNVNSASREDLVNIAGLRPDLADAVLGFRRQHGRITDVQALEELPGIGPATLDQLRKTLDFADKGGNGSDQAGRDERGTTETTHKAAEATRQTATEGARVAEATAREGVEIVHSVFGAAAETEREVVSRSAEGVAELGRLWMDLLSDQTRHNLEIATSLGRAVRWDEVLRTQSEFVRASLERLNELNRRYLEIVRGMTETTSAAVERARKAG
jgi:competence ComEA-like helix-hairpin-helix protein